MSRSLELVDAPRAIIDRRSLADELSALSGRKRNVEAADILKRALEQGRAEVARRLIANPDRGRSAARATAYLHDQLVRLAHDFIACGTEEQVAIVGLGGTGRGEMAPFSDVDLMFLTAAKPSAGVEQCVEAVLHLLWDLKL